MSFTTDDFTECLACAFRDATFAADQVERVIAAWGRGDGAGRDAGHPRWSDHSATEWRGGFLVALKDGRSAYVTGWNDYTGWG